MCAAALTVATALTLTACGGTSLSDGDRAACQASAAGNARGVFAASPLVTNPKIQEQAVRIFNGSPNEVDMDAMTKINAICKDAGFESANL